eukprot:scaffold12822_cov112-Isochrysis_galbana.AAC.4
MAMVMASMADKPAAAEIACTPSSKPVVFSDSCARCGEEPLRRKRYRRLATVSRRLCAADSADDRTDDRARRPCRCARLPMTRQSGNGGGPDGPGLWVFSGPILE